jgi:anti-sigma regulatory factor (Ser/Thr protein kinase)
MHRGSHSRTGRRRPALQEDRSSPTVGYITDDLLLREDFDGSTITALRHAVASCAAAAGLTADRLDDFVVAVNELLTNAVRHGGGGGRLTLRHAAGRVECEVSDEGPGLTDALPDRRPARPATDQPGGWGLWLVEELTDAFEVVSGTGGTTVRISSRISLREP